MVVRHRMDLLLMTVVLLRVGEIEGFDHYI